MFLQSVFREGDVINSCLTCVCAGIYLTMVMAMTGFSIVVCVVVLDLHHRNPHTAVPDASFQFPA